MLKAGRPSPASGGDIASRSADKDAVWYECQSHSARRLFAPESAGSELKTYRRESSVGAPCNCQGKHIADLNIHNCDPTLARCMEFNEHNMIDSLLLEQLSRYLGPGPMPRPQSVQEEMQTCPHA